MLTFFLGLLVVANSGLIAYNAGFLGAAGVTGREPARVKNQLNAERMRIEPVALTLPATSGGAAIAVAGAGQSCIEIGDFDIDEATRFDAQLASLAIGNLVSRLTVPQIERYIVYIPPLPNRALQSQKLAQLRQRGVEDFYVFNDNSELRQGISLGMFKTADAAQQHLQKITRQGVDGIQVVTRAGLNKKTAFQIRGLDGPALEGFNRMKPAFPKQETRSCKIPQIIFQGQP